MSPSDLFGVEINETPSKKKVDRTAYKQDWQRKQRESVRDLGEIPSVQDPQRREDCRFDFVRFCFTYNPYDFYLDLSDAHLQIMQTVQDVVLHGGLVSCAIPRGFGKTSIFIEATKWAILYGHRKFVMIIGNEGGAGQKILKKIAAQFAQENTPLACDFPEVCYPVSFLGGVLQRASSLMYQGEHVPMKWSGTALQFPDLPGSECGGSAITSTGIEGNIKGTNIAGKNGQAMRPDLVLLDDPQDAAVAKSKTRVAYRLDIIHSDILGLNDASNALSVFASVTIVRGDDLADQLTNPKKCPQWISFRYPAVMQWPCDDALPLWDNYKQLMYEDIERADPKYTTARKFYLDNRELMDKGAKVMWPQYFTEGQVSNLQWAYEKRIMMGDDNRFFGEYQQTPPDDALSEIRLYEDDIFKRCSGAPLIAPEWTSHIVCAADINPALRGIVYIVAAFDRAMRCHIIDLGEFPPSPDEVLWSEHFTRNMTEDQAIVWGVRLWHEQMMRKVYFTQSGRPIKITGCIIDSGYEYNAVLTACQPINRTCLPIRGRPDRYYQAVKPNDLKKGTCIDFKLARFDKAYNGDQMRVNTDAMRARVLKGLKLPEGVAGAITIAGRPELPAVKMLASELTSEWLVRYLEDDKGRVYTWGKDSTQGRRNELLDALVYAQAGALFCGCQLIDEASIPDVAKVAERPVIQKKITPKIQIFKQL